MELGGNPVHFLENKAILITGATGFLAKILVEKILRVQPNVKKLFLLVRAADTKSATERFNNEVIGKDLFKVLKEKWGESLNSLISEKVTLVPGDISCEDLGVRDSSLREEMWREVDMVINSAATTNFNERYDVALSINTFGAKHVLSFAKKCSKIMVLVHVATAYVCGEREGVILEKPFHTGETLNETTSLDIDAELKLVEKRLNELQVQGATGKEITLAMKDLGITRARMHGWPNTYVFTKAMGEMLLGKYKENMSLVISRPTMITSTFKDPFPGWIEGSRTMDALLVAYGKGKLKYFPVDPMSISDAIPADMVVNSIIVAMAANANQPSQVIYHVGSSMKNPLKYRDIQDFGYHYFTNKPWIKNGKPVKVHKFKMLSSMASLHRLVTIQYLLPLKVLKLGNMVSCQIFHGKYNNLNKRVRSMLRFAELYQPYVFFRGIFDDTNTERLRMAAASAAGGVDQQTDVFLFDPQCIQWDDYFMNCHLPGLVKYAFM